MDSLIKNTDNGTTNQKLKPYKEILHFNIIDTNMLRKDTLQIRSLDCITQGHEQGNEWFLCGQLAADKQLA